MTSGPSIAFRAALAVVLRKDAAEIHPFTVLPRLASGELKPEAWQELRSAQGIKALDLGGAEGRVP